MRYSQAQVDDSKYEAEHRRTFKGSARISLDVLGFQRYKHRDLDTKHVDYLKSCFRKDKCRRLEARNHIEAEIDQESLENALRSSDVTSRQLLTHQPHGCPWLRFPKDFQLQCLHGHHRIQAAREFLLPTDKWWTVDLYTSDINEELKICLNEQHSNEDRPSDGEAYCKIRYYHFQRDTKSELRWKACLWGCRLKNLKELLADGDLTAGFDALLDIPGVWDGMMLTTLQKMMAMGCKYEILNYLANIKEVFVSLVGKDGLGKIDTATVKAMERRAPGVSTVDAQHLRNLLRGGEIFGAFSDRERDQIWGRLQQVDSLVPSLFTFFRDIQYLKLCVDCLKRLVIVPKRESVCETLQGRYTGVNQKEGQVRVQVTEDIFEYQAGTLGEPSDLGSRQLVAFAMRHYPDMPADPIRGDPVQKAAKQADPTVLRMLADLAYELGFDSPQIRSMKQYPRLNRRDINPQSSPLLVTSGPGIAMSHRSGNPRQGAYEESRGCLYINHLHDEQQHQGEGITSFFVRKYVYLAFFGRPSSTASRAADRSPTGPPSGNIGSRNETGFSEQPDEGQSQGNPGHAGEDIDDILSSYARRDPLHNADAAEDTSDPLNPGGTNIILPGSGERERQESEREERERQENQAMENERRKRKRREQERLAQAKIERKRREQDRLERERLQAERLEEQRLEEQRLEEQRLEEQRLEEQRLEEQRLEEQRLEEQRLEDQRVEEQRLEEQRLEEQRLEDQRVEEQRMEEQRLEELRLEQVKVSINFIIRESGSWRDLRPVDIDPGDPSEVERIAKKYIRKNIRTFNTRLQMLAPQECFQTVIDDRTHTILLIPQDDLDIDNEMVESALKLHTEARKRILGLKRAASDDLSRQHIPKKQALNPKS